MSRKALDEPRYKGVSHGATEIAPVETDDIDDCSK